MIDFLDNFQRPNFYQNDVSKAGISPRPQVKRLLKLT
jgi:hypothetical protein